MNAADDPDARAFAEAMEALGPFERAPAVAVAVSGGSDSLALTLLAADWTRSVGGRLAALTVDHGLRPDSAREARQVGRWLKAYGIPHRILTWDGPRPGSGLQAAARAARYGLLAGWCRRHGVLHLLLGHQAEDQAETFLLRLARGSGVDGLAGMAPVAVHGGVRLLRPLLARSREDLRALLRRRGQPWLDDPSNENPAFGRTGARRLLRSLQAAGLSPARLNETARQMGEARELLEAAACRLAAESVALHPAGFCRVDVAALLAAPEALQQRLLGRVLLSIGGLAYAPRRERVARLREAVAGGTMGRGRTLAGCGIRPCGGGLLIFREAAALPADIGLGPGEAGRWDRFEVRLGAQPRRARGAAWRVGALGEAGWRALKADSPEVAAAPLPRAVRPSLPALWRGARPVAVPHLGCRIAGSPEFQAVFRPPQSLTPVGFRVV